MIVNTVNVRLFLKKYSAQAALYLLGLYVVSFFGIFFDEWNRYLAEQAKSPLLHFAGSVLSILNTSTPLYSLILSLGVVWVFNKIWIRIKVDKSDLKITNATYGKNGAFVEVSDKLNAAVEGGKLRVLVSNAIAGDPVPGVPKVAKLTYRYGDREYRKEYVEGEVIELP